MSAVAVRRVVLVYPRCCVALAALCGAGWVPAQEVAPQWEWASQPTPLLPPAGGRMESRISLTGWSGQPPEAGIGWGLALPLPLDVPRGGWVRDADNAAAGLNLGLHWRSADEGRGRMRIGVWQDMGTGFASQGIASQTYNPLRYNTRLEMQFSAASARGLQFELGGALGLQINPNERVVLRLSKGRTMVYYRVKF